MRDQTNDLLILETDNNCIEFYQRIEDQRSADFDRRHT